MSICWTQPSPGIVDSDGFCFRYTDKPNNDNEQYLFSNWWREQIDTYGTKITYFVNQYNILSADNFYGEQPNKVFSEGVEIVGAVQLAENADMLSKFGFASDDAITMYIHVSSFQSVFENVGLELLTDENVLSGYIDTENLFDIATELPGTYETQFNQVQPKAGDVFALSEYGLGRFGQRGAKQFEITEIQDEDIATINQLGGHYVWMIKAKRYDYSFEPGLSSVFRAVNIDISNVSYKSELCALIKAYYPDFVKIITLIQAYSATWSPTVTSFSLSTYPDTTAQVYDETFSGLLSGGKDEDGNITGPSEPKKYPFNVDLTSSSFVFDMSANDSTEIYGEYY